MSVSIGRRGYVGVAIETFAGSGGDTPVKYLPYTSQTFHNVVDILDDEAAKGIRERAWGSVVARERGEGDITILLDVENAPFLLYPALGTMVTQRMTGGFAYQHTVTRKSSNPPRTICLNVYDTAETTGGIDNVRKYHYGTINTCELTFSDGWVELATNILSEKPTSGSGSRGIDEETVMAFKDAKIYFGSTFAQAELNYQNDSGAIPLTTFRLTINNNAEAQYVAGSESPAQISIGQFEIGGDYTLFFEDTTEQTAHENQTKRAMVVIFTGATVTGSSATETLYIGIPQFHITDRGIDTAPAGFVTENPTFVGDYSDDGSIVVKIINGTAFYPGQVLSSSSSMSSSSSFSSSSQSYSSSSFSSSSASFSSSSSSSW